MKKIFLASIIANIILFQLWQFEKGKRIEQQAAFSATEEERRVKNEKSICTEKKIAVLRKKRRNRKIKIAIALTLLCLMMLLSGCASKRAKNNCIYSIVTTMDALECVKQLHEAQ